MKPRRPVSARIALAFACMALLAGCQSQAAGVDENLTWQEAKADAQQMETDVAALIPDDVVVRREQRKTGSLFSCDDDQHQWVGRTTVTVLPGTDTEALIQGIQQAYEDDDAFEANESQDINGNPRAQLVATDDEGESYLVSRGRTETELDITSGSKCFTLPDDVYPGGDF